MKTLLISLLLLFSGFANASLITVKFEVTIFEEDDDIWGTGTFAGMDDNNDGYLSFDELIMFDGSDNIEEMDVMLGDLFDFGDYDIANNIWMGNAVGWLNNPDNAFFTWNNRNNSVNSEWAEVSTMQVPEPGALLTLGFGLLGLSIRRRANR